MRHHIIAIRRAISRNKQTIITNVDENVKQLELLHITGRNVKWYTSVENNRHFSKEMSLFSPIQPLSRVRLFATPWTAAHQASLSITNSQSLLKLMSIELAMPSNHLIFCQMANKHMKRCSTSFIIQSVQFSAVAQLCLTLCDPMNHNTPDLPVHHQLPKFTQTHAH